MKNYLSLLFLGVLCTLLVACSSGGVSLPATQDVERGPAMVVTANPLASKAGADVLAAGGSAVDAAIAIEAVLSLVEPQSSGLGGGGFLVYFNNETNDITSYDGRETAPMSAKADRFMLPSGEKMGYLNAKHSGLSTGVPGMVSMLSLAHQDHGKLPWSSLFDAARHHATVGFEVSPRLHGMIQRFGKYLPKTAEEGPTEAWDYFHLNDGQPLPVGHVLKNSDYADALGLIAADPANFYSGALAQQIVAEVNKAPRAGNMELSDLTAYSAERQNALCTAFRAGQLCGPPPPSSWLAVAMVMGILHSADAFSEQGAEDPANWALFGEAQRLAYADRDRYVADSRQVIVPITGLLHPDYLALRGVKGEMPCGGRNRAFTASSQPWQKRLRRRCRYRHSRTRRRGWPARSSE